MSERTSSLQYVVRISIATVLIALIALATVGRASANQSGPGVNEAAEFQQKLCIAGGGTPVVETYRTVGSGLFNVSVKCKGGLLDGLDCENWNNAWGTWCHFDLTRQPQTDVVEPNGGIEESPGDVIDTPVIVDEVIEPAPAEEITDEPIIDEPEIIEDVVAPVVAEEPVVEEVTDPIVDSPVVDESVEPVVAEDPLVQEVVPIDIPLDPVSDEETVWEYDLDYEIEVEEPIVIE